MTVTDETAPTDVEVGNFPHRDDAHELQDQVRQAPGQGSPPEAAQDDDAGQDERPANREARYRREAREAQAQVAELIDRVTRMQRAEVERLAARLHNPGDLWTAGVDLVELMNEDGEVDPERVAEAVAALADSKPYLLKPPRSYNFGQGKRTPVDSGTGTTWGSVLRGRP
jgi:hypothetical protein